MKTRQKIYLPFKRLIGLFGAIVGIILCSILLWWWVFIINSIVTKGHPVFSHYRVGKDNKLFKLYKFRSMRLDVNPNMTSEFAKGKNTTTKFGKFLRAASIDETLQLINIFKGDMAFVGPRPLIEAHEDIITLEERRKNGSIHLRPGITGYAQIHGRTLINSYHKGVLDGIYLEKISLWEDFLIFVYTILIALRICKDR